MAKKEAYYFSHDANAQDDHKCMVLIDQLGMEGYGIFWALIEKLRSEKEYKLPLNVCSSFAKRWGTSKEKIEAVVKNYSLFTIDEFEYFFSLRLKSSMELKSEKATKSILSRWNNTNVLQPNTNVIRNDTIKVKESKEKENNNIDSRKLKFASTLQPFLPIYGKDVLNDFYAYWTEPNKSNTKFRQELEKAWDVERRLKTWTKNETIKPKVAKPYPSGLM